MFTLRFSFIFMVLLVSTSLCFVNVSFAKVSEEEAASVLAEAERTLTSAYQAVLKAEESGANGTALLVQLNDAGELLARARMAYRSGNFNEVSVLVNSCKTIGLEVESAAVELKDSAISEGLQRMILTMTASVAGIAVIAVGSFWTWYLLRKRCSTL